MKRWRLPLAVLGIALVQAGAAVAAAPRPSERACLLAWNAPANAANRSRLAAGTPWASASLGAGTTYRDTWRRGSAPMQTAAPACLLALWKPGWVRVVTGTWRRGRVVGWSFGRAIAVAKAPGGSNVRVLPDGRVTKIYRR